MTALTELSTEDLTHLRRCVELAREALADGDEPFGSLLVDPQGAVLREDRNRTAGGDQTRHPELELARWAATHVPTEVRPSCTVYTSGEHCPMCAAGHAWVGLGRIVYAGSTAQLPEWRQLGRGARAGRAPAHHRRGTTRARRRARSRARRGAARAAPAGRGAGDGR